MWLHRTAEVSNVAWIWSLHVLLLKPVVFMSRSPAVKTAGNTITPTPQTDDKSKGI